MKKQLSNLYIAFFLLGATMAVFAQPGSGNSTNDLESADVAAPIDSYLWILVLVGLAYSFWKFNSKQKSALKK